MATKIAGLVAGLIFGLGLVTSQMTNPEKVLSFLDILGDWDPSLAFVLGSALAVTAIGYRLVWRRAKPVFGDHFQVPGSTSIDRPLALGAILFGIGWGLAGLCPGPAIAAITIGGPKALTFLGAMTIGVIAHSVIPSRT